MRLPRSLLAAYAAPSLPLAAMYFPVYVFLAEYYASDFGFSLGFIGAAFIAVRLFDAVSDPAMGLLSDGLRTRWGRRRIWLAIGCPIVMVSVWCLFVPPVDVNRTWFVTFLFLLTLGWTVMLTPYFAWGAEITGDYAERGRVAIWRDSIGLVGTILAAILYTAGGTAAAGMTLVAAAIVLMLPASVIWCLRVVPEPRDWSRERATDLRDLIRVIRAEPLFLRLLGAYFINGAANALPATLFLFFVEYRLGAPGQGGLLLVLYFGAAVAAAPFWTFALRRISKHRLWCLAMIYAGIIFSVALTLGEGDIAAFAVICVLSGAALGADLALPSAMQADLVDLDTARSGRQRTGAFFALWSLATKFALALSGGLALILLEFAGFEANAANTGTALLSLALLYAAAPIALKAIAVAMMWRFPMDEAAQAALRQRIETRA
ncbi:MFS transporter [Halovulum dunhuangense]|uniref:MFS transporter n=1 Tax=Halovulum dunhuangense TaxID=1505036 RepID=A0A849L1A4_9RHOB|nr:MFS transporter [Halovulum dunhuangense]NNU80052.1 MFS transporter [Halovulum dunhuangense]